MFVLDQNVLLNPTLLIVHLETCKLFMNPMRFFVYGAFSEYSRELSLVQC
ncbi:hypothetical protein MUK42_34965 [Musa troglodytarum]|uniref:Uncharacterized protein n=1 Tax=Musa troglodytarum TaxID=320322 RepID=A0A9E7K8G6_9LILI|nr:hypothetical protein MUK42_34965 [Musa troglodytarum]